MIRSSGIDLSVVWDEAGRPKESRRALLRGAARRLAKAAVDFLAGRRGVRPEAIFHDPGGPKAHVEADPAVAVIYRLPRPRGRRGRPRRAGY
ncbi:MAG: hypothetical protein WKF75_20960 [Singulisphaera sp.]